MTTTLRPPAPSRVPASTPVPTARITPRAALVLIVLGALPVLGLWWRDTQFVYGLGSELTNAGRILGLACGYAILVVLALMARVPALERGVGADRLARWHAAGGRYVVSLAVAHTLLIIWGYAVAAHTDVVTQTSTLLLTYPDVMMATAAVGLFLLIGVTSARAARKRLRYETWHLIHLYTYLAVALSFAHEFATGADFRDVRVRALWLGLYLIVGALLLWYRVLTPLLNLARHTLRVAAVVPHGPDTLSVVVTGRNLHRLAARPGQFFRWRFLTPGLWGAANPYSLSAAPGPDQLRITVKVSGEHSARLRALRPGTRVLAEGPYGAFVADPEFRSPHGRRTGKVLLLGVGIGITPIRALLETVPAAPGGITVVYRARRPADLVLRDEIDDWVARRGARVHYLLGRRTRHDHLSLDRLQRLVPDLVDHEIYMCGPEDLTARLARDLRGAGVPGAAIHFESFAF